MKHHDAHFVIRIQTIAETDQGLVASYEWAHIYLNLAIMLWWWYFSDWRVEEVRKPVTSVKPAVGFETVVEEKKPKNEILVSLSSYHEHCCPTMLLSLKQIVYDF